jgi:ribonucleotide monophosphatase NagD (HAD superfamily)
MIGDRLDTDMLFGIKSGIKTCLVFTGIICRKIMSIFIFFQGIASLEDLQETAVEHQPDFYISGLGNIVETLNR